MDRFSRSTTDLQQQVHANKMFEVLVKTSELGGWRLRWPLGGVWCDDESSTTGGWPATSLGNFCPTSSSQVLRKNIPVPYTQKWFPHCQNQMDQGGASFSSTSRTLGVGFDAFPSDKAPCERKGTACHLGGFCLISGAIASSGAFNYLLRFCLAWGWLPFLHTLHQAWNECRPPQTALDPCNQRPHVVPGPVGVSCLDYPTLRKED